MSARTDGRAPVMPVTGLPYGQNQEVNAQQSAAPMGAPAGPGGGGGGGAPAGGGGRPMGPDGIFSGTERPGEPMTAGAPMGPGSPGHSGPILEPNVDLMLQALAAKYQHPDLIALVNRGRGS